MGLTGSRAQIVIFSDPPDLYGLYDGAQDEDDGGSLPDSETRGPPLESDSVGSLEGTDSRSIMPAVVLHETPVSEVRSYSPSPETPQTSMPTVPACPSKRALLVRHGDSRHQLSPLRVPPPGSPTKRALFSHNGGRKNGPGRSLDRFIPFRPISNPNVNFHMTRLAATLTPGERLNRHRDSGPDVFSRVIRRPSALDQARQQRLAQLQTSVRATSAGAQRLPVRPSSTSMEGRPVSYGSAWAVGGSAAIATSVLGIPSGRGGMLGVGTNAPLYTSSFFKKPDVSMEADMHERRLALALDVDQTSRMLDMTISRDGSPCRRDLRVPANSPPGRKQLAWKNNEWTRDSETTHSSAAEKETKAVPIIPFRYVLRIQIVALLTTSTVLDAPSLRDDFYCSLLAYSHTRKCLAVGLASHVYLWTENRGVDTPASVNEPFNSHVTSLSFSSEQGGQAILAIGRADGRIVLWSPLEDHHRFDSQQPHSVSCVAFRPNIVKRPSMRDRYLQVNTEDLLVGDEAGNVFFYSVEWPDEQECALFDWDGAFTLLAKISVHTQQICGLAWQSDGALFATGGNDNSCYLFETKRIANATKTPMAQDRHGTIGPHGQRSWTVITGQGPILDLGRGYEKHRWSVNAAVKAIAFCPWQRGLVAVGGGSNDRCIHFYHTGSGACLATIDCAAQLTSLIWSTTRKEIVATFGFAQPEHPYRIAVFSWPKCEQVLAIPWHDEHRALFAIAYPGGPNDGASRGEGGTWCSRTAQEGSIVVATSDSCIKFHEVWSDERRASVAPTSGLLGGSDILESLHGIDKELERLIR